MNPDLVGIEPLPPDHQLKVHPTELPRWAPKTVNKSFCFLMMCLKSACLKSAETMANNVDSNQTIPDTDLFAQAIQTDYFGVNIV